MVFGLWSRPCIDRSHGLSNCVSHLLIWVWGLFVLLLRLMSLQVEGAFSRFQVGVVTSP